MVGGILATAVLSCAFAEFYGYWLHKLLHSDKIEFLSRSHMIHHLIDYAPNKPMRPFSTYIYSSRNRTSLLNIGLEWLLPVGLILAAALAVFQAVKLAAIYQITFCVTSLSWGYFMFAYLHDAMHVQGFWMEKRPWLSKWFLGSRRLHDIHHMTLDDAGRMTRNFGIGFYFFDRLFGTLAGEHTQFNRQGHEAALKRYAYIFEEGLT